MATPDDPIVERVRNGDPEAMALFVEQNRSRLMAFVERQLGTALRRKVEPEDIVQEASVDAVRGIATMDLSERDPFGWLCQICERRIVDAHRRFFDAQKRDAGREVPLGAAGGDTQQPGLINMLVASLTTPSQAFSRNVKEQKIAAALAELPEDQQEALRLRYVEGLPSKTIAERLGKNDGAVRVMLTRAVKRLGNLIDEQVEP